MFSQQQVKPKKVYLNYNLIKREFQTERTTAKTRTNSLMDHPTRSYRNSLTSLSVDYGNTIKQQPQVCIKEYCYLFYVDEGGLNDRLRFQLKPILQSCTRNCIPNLLSNEIYKLFLPYSFSGEQFVKLQNISAVINQFHQFKIGGDEYQIQKMFDYFFVPSRELSTQILSDLKYQLSKNISKPISVITFFDGTEINNICQLGWNPPTLLCAESKQTLLKQLPKIYEKVRVSKRLKQLQQFKAQIIQQCAKSTSMTDCLSSYERQERIQQNLKQIKQIQQQIEFQKEYDIQLPKLVIQNVQPKFRLIKPITEQAEEILDHLSLEMIDQIKLSSPKLDTFEIYQYYIDFKSLCMIDPKFNGVQFQYFAIYNDLMSIHCQEEQIRIYRAMGVNIDNCILRWKEYLLFRTLQDNKGNPQQVIIFLLNYFMNDNQELDETSITSQLSRLSQRLNKENDPNPFSDRYTVTIVKWMVKSGFFVNGQLNRDVMLEQYEKNEYIFLFIINCILGQFKTNVLEWFYNIY